MQAIMRKLPLILSTLILMTALNSGAVTLDIGNDLLFEFLQEEREGRTVSTEIRQRARFYLKGYLQDGIQIGTRIHSAGLLNSTDTHITYEGALIGNQVPYFESAYIRVKDVHGLPVSLSAGLQPIKWAEGVLINDNLLGLPSISAMGTEPYTGISGEAYHVWARDELRGISDITGYGARIFRQLGPGVLELNYTSEDYVSPAPAPLLDDSRVTRDIFGGNYSRELESGIEYSFFGYLMRGRKAGEEFDGSAIGAYGRFEGVVEPIGRGGTWIRYILGTGDPEDDERGFMPVLSSVESRVIGDYYGRNREFMMVDGVRGDEVQTEAAAPTLSNKIANLSMLRYAIYATVLDDITVHMIRSTYKQHDPSVPVGGSLTFGAEYDYSLLNVALNYTVFAPEPAYDRYEGTRRTRFLTMALSARF